MTALEIERPDGRTKKLVLRRHGAEDLRQNPQAAADEFKLLQILQSAGLAVPTPYHLDDSREIFPTPYLVFEYVEGDSRSSPPDLDDGMRQLAAQLAMLHGIDGADRRLSFLPRQEAVLAEIIESESEGLDEALSEGQVRNALRSAWPLPRQNGTALLHGDCWPGNIIWRDGRLVGVVDWEDAALGDPLADVANTRLELFWTWGASAMERFTDHYRSMTRLDFSNLPYWDLCAALRLISRISDWGLDEMTEKAMRQRHGVFVRHAFESLPARPMT